MPESQGIAPELADTYWGRLVSATPGQGPRNRVGQSLPAAGNTARVFNGGFRAPRAEELTPQMRSALLSSGGTLVTEKQGQKLLELGWTYGDPAPKGFKYDSFGRLADEYTLAQGLGQVAMASVPLVATALTAGAASPWLAASVGGAAGLSAAKLSGASWKNALIAGAAGAAGAGLAAAPVNAAAHVAGQAGINAASTAASGGSVRDALTSAAIGGASTAASAVKPGGGTMAATTQAAPLATNTSLANHLIQSGIAAAGTYAAGGGVQGAVVSGAQAAATPGQTNTQAALQAGTTLAARILSGAQAAGNAAGNAAAAREAGRQTEAGNIVTQDQQRLQAQTAAENAVQGRANVDLNQRQEGRTEANDAYANALRAALALNTKDASFNRPKGVPTISLSGGARPSAIGQQGHDAAEIMSRRALDTLMNPKPQMDLPEMQNFTPTTLPKASGVDTALGVAGTIGNVLTGMQQNSAANERSSLISALLQQSQQQAQQGVSAPPAVAAAPKPRTLQDEIDEVSRRVSGGA